MKLVISSLIAVILKLLLFSTDTIDKDILTSNNQLPIVTIKYPKNNITIQPGTNISYSIEVSDPEDGETRYNEIPNGEIFMEIRYYQENPSKPSVPEVEQGLMLMKTSDCFTCHQWNTVLVGPPISQIMEKYNPSHLDQLSNSILEGSSEKWGSVEMPAQLTITPAEVSKIAEWLTSTEDYSNRTVLNGSKGVFHISPDTKTGYYSLIASYTDKGSPGKANSRKTGWDHIVVTVKP